jgi:hypothetical protein
VTAAARFIVAFAWTCEGGDGMKLTAERLVDGAIAIGGDAMLTWGSAVEVALIVTIVPADGTGGAVYVATPPLAVWYGTIVPQPPATVLPHCTVQVMPPGATSFATMALTGA